MRELKIFSGQANQPLAQAICGFLNIPLGAISLGKFPDGENFCKIEEDIRGRDIYLVQPTCPPTNETLMELLIMLDCCKRASAARITAVIPYFGYARQDRKDEGRTPITAKLTANLISRAGANRVLAMDLHAAQIQGFFDVPVDHLYAAPVLNEHFLELGLADDDIVVVSPDEGSIKRASRHAKQLGGRLAIIDKRRTNAMETTQETIIGSPVKGRAALVFDDLISTGGSICGAAELIHQAGAREIHVAASHGLLCGPAIANIQAAPITSIVITNSITLPPDRIVPQIKVLSVAPLLAEAIKRIHHDQSVSAMFCTEEEQ
ncbi:MAG: ribose-phosphate diphosphokinase [Planctomycetota bacterium]